MNSTPDLGLAAAFGGFMVGSSSYGFSFLIAIYVIMGLVHYKLFHKANVNRPWLACVRIGNL